MSLPPHDVLARRALDSPLLCDALSLARWSGPATPVTSGGVPGIDDARSAISRFSLWPHDLSGRIEERVTWLGGLHSAAEVAHFVVPWSAALRLGLVRIDGSLARPHPDLERRIRDPEQVLEWWFHEFEHTIAHARGDLARPHDPGPGTTGPDLLPEVLRFLYEAPDGHRPDLDTLAATALTGPPPPAAPGLPRTTDLLLHVLWQLSDTGAVALDHHPDGEGEDRCTVELTGLGRYGVRLLLLEVGIHAPLVDTLAEACASRFLDALAVLPFEERSPEAAAWLDRRGSDEALRQITEVVRGPGLALRRWVAAQVLNNTSSELEPRLRALLTSPRATEACLAAMVLLSSGMLGQRGIDHLLAEYGPWVVVDMVAAAMSPDGSALPAFLAADDTPDVDRLLLVGADPHVVGAHPDALMVLDGLVHHHPDPDAAARARELAVRLRVGGRSTDGP
ncbi:hypothetical protein [Nocardiopsis sp. MG754419]|uniref:hypothetical protein n=1 Tax=Nocardiopsis sp. MG754419 TaxID=2259865 RepID=UPI001BADF1CC|nr:hypothetical protein [Nocardiopsis sp. MG754419]MBR8743018.1 hypothetical protein [Nocardiopsis sp. MG754419]